MVKLKVYVRVIPESVYGADAVTVAPRKFVVVVRDPTEWHIGTLAREAQRSYQRLYRNELGKIKYLKDGDDNDLDPEQYVSDIFVNEGKAARDGHDQEAVIKLVQEQGHAVRADSVVPDLTPAHYSQPPPSRLLGNQSSLGKRSHGTISGLQEAGSVKRSKLVEIPESQVVPSVERSPELIHDTQRAGVEDDVFDDAREYHPSNAPDRATAATASVLPVTPSVNALPNGTTTKSPVQQASSASRFRVGNHRDVYAFPESDIEDSQMVNVHPEIATNGIHSSQSANQTSSQAGPLPKAVTEFNAEEALYPMDLDEPIPAVPQEPSDGSPRKKDVVPNETESFDSGDESSDQEPAELKIPNARQQPAVTKENMPTDSPESKRQKTPKFVNGTAQDKQKQTQTAQRKSPVATSKNRKQSQSNSVSKAPQLQPALTLSPSRRTSGVVSELDSPGEQLSQGLHDSTKDQQLADGLRTLLAGKQRNKKQRLREDRFDKKASASASSSVSGSRPGSREGPTKGPASKKKAKKQSQGNGQDGQHLQKQTSNEKSTSKTFANTEAAKSDKSTKPKSLKEKLADASVQAVAQTSKAVSDSSKDKQTAISDDESDSDEEGAPLPSIENTPIAPGKVSSNLPLPNWSSGSNGPNSAAVGASPAFIIPVGMTEEEYRRLRAQNESTPQPPKITPATKRKASTPAAIAKTPASVAKEAVNKGKKVVEEATELAKTAAKKTIAVESSSEEESSSSSEESDSASNKKKGKAGAKSSSTKSSTKSASKSASPVEARKTQLAKSSKANEPVSMPPPTPKSTAKRRESMNKQQMEWSSSSASTQATSSQQTSSKSSSSSSPAPTKTPAKTKPQVNAAQPKKSTPATNKQPTSAATASPAPAANPLRPAITNKRESALKTLRAKINSEAASPAPSISSVRAKKAAAIAVSSSSSSSEEESSSEESSDDKQSAQKKQSLGKAKINTPLRVAKPDPSIRDPSPDESGSSDD